MSLADIVSVAISTAAVVPSRTSFGIPLIFGYHNRFAERHRVYTTLAGMVADGFATTDKEYRAAAKLLAQNPKVKSFIVGRCANAPTQIEDLVPVVKDSHTYTVTIDGITSSFTSGVGATAQQIVEGMIADINTDMPVNTVIATEDNTKVTLTSEVAGRLFELEVDRRDWTRDDVSADPGIVADLQAITVENDTYYTVHPTFNGTLSAIALAAEIETKKKIFIAVSADGDILAGNGLGATLKASSYARTAVMFHALPHEYPGVAWAGKVLPKDPGSATWKFKTLAGITIPEIDFTSAQQTFMRGDNVNFYHAIADVGTTEEGYSASGEYLDTTQGVDWMSSRLQERIFGRMINADKIPFTDKGIGIIESEVRAQVQEGINSGFIADDPAAIITVPKAADVDDADKSERNLPGVTFEAPLAGAVHAVAITGSITV